MQRYRMRKFLIEVFITDTSETFHVWHQQSMFLHLRQKCQVSFQDFFFSIPLPPSHPSLPIHHHPHFFSKIWFFFRSSTAAPGGTQQLFQPEHSCSRNFIPLVNKKKSLSICLSPYLHTVPTGQRSGWSPECTKAVLCDGNFGQFLWLKF